MTFGKLDRTENYEYKNRRYVPLQEPDDYIEHGRSHLFISETTKEMIYRHPQGYDIKLGRTPEGVVDVVENAPVVNPIGSWEFDSPVQFNALVNGIALNEIEDPENDVNLSMGGNTVTFNFTNPVGGMLFNMTGGWSGHVFEVLDNAASPSGVAGDHLMHLETDRENVVTAHIIQNFATGTALWVEGKTELDGLVEFNGQQIFASGEEQELGTGYSPTFAGLTLDGNLLAHDGIFSRDDIAILEVIGLDGTGGIVGTDTNHDLLLRRNNILKLTLASTYAEFVDDVGIGKTPTVALDVAGTIRSNVADPVIQFDRPRAGIIDGTILGALDWYAEDDSAGRTRDLNAYIRYIGTATWTGTSANAKLTFGIRENVGSFLDDALVLSNDGYFGIGRSPTSILDVYEDINSDSTFWFTNPNTGANARTLLRVNNDLGGINLIAGGSGYTGVAGWQNYGILGIDNNLDGMWIYTSGGDPIKISIGAVDNQDFRFDGTGFGIGRDNNPAYPLDVEGSGDQLIRLLRTGGNNGAILWENSDGTTLRMYGPAGVGSTYMRMFADTSEIWRITNSLVSAWYHPVSIEDSIRYTSLGLKIEDASGNARSWLPYGDDGNIYLTSNLDSGTGEAGLIFRTWGASPSYDQVFQINSDGRIIESHGIDSTFGASTINMMDIRSTNGYGYIGIGGGPGADTGIIFTEGGTVETSSNRRWMIGFDEGLDTLRFYQYYTSGGVAVNQTKYLFYSDKAVFDVGELEIQEASPQIYFNDTGGEDDFWIHVNSNNFYVLVDRDGSGSWESPHPLQLEGDTNVGYLFDDRMLTVADEGSGNGLDADTVDGKHASSFIESGDDPTFGDRIAFSSNYYMEQYKRTLSNTAVVNLLNYDTYPTRGFIMVFFEGYYDAALAYVETYSTDEVHFVYKTSGVSGTKDTPSSYNLYYESGALKAQNNRGISTNVSTFFFGLG